MQQALPGGPGGAPGGRPARVPRRALRPCNNHAMDSSDDDPRGGKGVLLIQSHPSQPAKTSVLRKGEYCVPPRRMYAELNKRV